jgi:hypothetical protein
VFSALYRKTFFEAYCYLRNREFSRAPKQIWVHIGATKTGSTTIQHVLRDGRPQLRRQSICFDGQGYNLGKNLMRQSPLSDDALAELQQFWQNRIARRPERTIILSAESFCGDPYCGSSNAQFVARDLRRILDGLSVEIVAVVRRQDRWTESIYQQYIKGGRSASFDDFVRKCGPFPVHWDKLLDEYALQFGSEHVHAHVYETLFSSAANPVMALFGPLMDEFKFEVAGLPRRNPGVSQIGLEVLRRCNELLTREQSIALRKFVEANFPAAGNSRYRYLDDDARDEFVRQCAESNERLFRKYLSTCDPSLYLPQTPEPSATNPEKTSTV